jgi:hypothetical protein
MEGEQLLQKEETSVELVVFGVSVSKGQRDARVAVLISSFASVLNHSRLKCDDLATSEANF